MPTELCHAICHKIGACWRLSVITMVMLMVVRGGCRAPPPGCLGEDACGARCPGVLAEYQAWKVKDVVGCSGGGCVGTWD